ncbi:MAG: substrate-binding domain-containing protein [Acidobacteria bacterium]|nr:substrate-binding domain-containing protein [Acidobacteriota bacterium]
MKKSSSVGAGTLDKGLTVLEAVESAAHPVGVNDIAAATGIQRLAVYRLLSTLQQRGYVQRDDDKRYRAATRRRKLLLGYAAPLAGNTFREDVATSLQQAARKAGIDLMLLDNADDDSRQVMRNAEILVEAGVDVAIFFQPIESLGHMMADRLSSAGRRFITVERPIPGGIYFGANNYQAGKLAGHALGSFALENWRGRFHHLVLVEGAHTSTNVQGRLAGVLVGLREVLPSVDDSKVIHLHGNANRDASRVAMAELLASLEPSTRLLISGFNDISAIGVLDAVRAARRQRSVAIVGHNAMKEGRLEIRKQGSPFIASVAYFPERYGERLVKLACAIAGGDVVAPAAYTQHAVLDRSNVDVVYPAEV